MTRTILHSDMNNFYASVECLHRPSIRNQPVVVGGNEEARHGIVLAKNYIAKEKGIRTGETLWEARTKCPDLVTVPPNFPLYLKYAKYAREIYSNYTDRIEPFGLDESWLDVTGDDGFAVANTIRDRIKRELGVTVSVGVSFNKIFAKLGSDLKKPDATTVITEDNYRQVVWPRPVEELLYVGPATSKKLSSCGVTTIGRLAAVPTDLLLSWFGKVGLLLSNFANGRDDSPVMRTEAEALIKSIGNSTTTPRDLVCIEDVKAILYILSESVCARMREHGLRGRTVVISVRDKDLFRFERQSKLSIPSCISKEVFSAAMQLFESNYAWKKPIRSIGVRCADLIPDSKPVQLSIFMDEQARIKQEVLDRTTDTLRERFGHYSIQRASVIADRTLRDINPKGDHVIHPVGFLKEGLK